MFKSKIFNSVMRYMLVAMLALLPNAIWGLTEISKYALLDNGSLTVAVDGVIPSGNYSLWYIENSAGEKVDINYDYWAGNLNGNVLVVNNNFNPWDNVKISAKDGNTANYHLVVLTSSDEKLKQLDTSVAEKKITFTVLSQDNIPLFNTSSKPCEYNDLFVIDNDKLDNGNVQISNIIKYLSKSGIWTTNGENLSLKDKPLYVRISIFDKNGKLVDPSTFTISPDIQNRELSGYPWGDPWTYLNNKSIYYLNPKSDWGTVSSSDLNYTFTCPAGTNITDYTIQVSASSEMPEISNKLIIVEPHIEAKITYNILSQKDLDNIKLVKSEDPSGENVKSVNFLYNNNSTTIDLTSSDCTDFIMEKLGVQKLTDITNLYVRWTLCKKDGSPIEGATCNNSSLLQQEKIYWTGFLSNDISGYSNLLKARFTLPEGLNLNDVILSCVISDETPTTEYGFVTKEPALKAKVNVQLLDKYSMPFNHYVGHANTALDENGMQQTAEWEYYVYVKDANEQVELVLPFVGYKGSSDVLEPQGYFRWYDFNKDRASANLRVNTGTTPTLLHNIKSGSEDYGLFAYNLYPALPTSSNIGVTYTAPAGASSDDWAGEDIACDVSRYIDGLDATKTYLVHEPTLSIRYIFHIRSAKKLADDIMNTAIGKNPQRAGYRTYQDRKYLTVGMKDKRSTLTLRLDLSDSKKYFFHPLVNGFTHRVYYADEKDKLVESDFDKTKICQATQIEWWAYDKTKTYCLNLGTCVNRFFDLAMNKFDGNWTSVSSKGETKNFTFQYGDLVYIVAYAMDDADNRCPIANIDLRFRNNHPMTKEEIVKEGLNNRLIGYLDEHYKMAIKPITFDDVNVEQTVAAPTSPDDNQNRLPSKWDRCAYSFVYRDLIDYDATNYGGLNKIGHSPLHGDYCLYKSANLSGVSTTSEKYLWWQTRELYDKTYEITNGSQYGHFLYVDASDESRKIAASDFNANFCTGQQLIFIASVADMTNAGTKPQIMFKLFGVNKDVNGEIVDKHLIHCFSSGDFSNNVEDLKSMTWYQVYGKITLQKESNVEKYSDFRLEIDNYCKGTQGADYAVDDIRMYLAPAKVQVIQEKPVCNGATTGTIKLKIRAIHETLNAILGHKDTKIYFRFVGEDGKPVTGDGFYSYSLKDKTKNKITKVEGTEYGTVDVYNSEENCKNFEIDGTNMIEQDSEGVTYIVISNKDYPLEVGKKYYVSVATETPDATGNSNWGSPAEVCSLYSNWFEMVSQHSVITDTDGKIVTDYKIPCDAADDYEIKIKGQLVTTDPNTGGKITLDGVKFIWYLDGKNEENKIKPSAPASNEITILKKDITLGENHQIFMKPEGNDDVDYIEYIAPNGKKYLLCPSAIPVPLRVMKDGPQLNFGFNDVDYPFKDGSYEASLRIGLPQLKKLKNTGFLEIPLHSATMGDGNAITSPLTFVDDSGTSAVTSDKVMVAYTNDPLWTTAMLNTQVATLQSTELPAIDKTTQATLNIKFSDAAVENFHEGYYYELRFAFEQRTASAGTTNCPGESYLKVKIVPEFITWTPTADGGMNANWNNDDNWHRSSSTELYDNEYTDYLAYGSSMSGTPTSAKEIPTLNSYVPMKFTKVTIDNLKGLPFPDLGNIVYRSTNKIATKLTNGKGNEATKYIQYDIMAFWNEADTEKGLDTEGNLKCEKFYGNTCHQIYFKPQGELRDQCYLIYDKAWVEKELVPNKWYTMASPLQYIYAGDMYVPASNGRQETKAFTDIKFDDKAADGTSDVYSRSKYPVYQRAWMKSDVKEITPKSDYPASHYPGGAAPGDVDMNLGYWSHVYNKVDESYAADGTFGGFSIKAGNALLPKDQTTNALLRLPKADTEYQYFDYNGTGNSSSETSVTKDPKGRGRLLVAFNNDEKHLAEKTQSLGTDNNSGFYLVANPYTCSISMAKFFEGNSGLKKAIWIVENGEVKATSTELDYKNYAIQPTQSFFVKKNDATVTDVRFTSTMCIDRTITPGLLMASDLKSIEATTENSNGQISKARIALRPEASADYDDEEDVDLLYDQNLKDIPQVYTVAGNEAVAVNAVPELSWIPLGIVSQQAEEVSLTLKGVSKLDAPVYLYDAASASFTELHEGEAVKVKAGDHGRYFLTQTRTSTGIDRMEAEEQSAPVKVYSPAAGMIVVSALGGEKLDRVQVFTLDGKMVHSYQLPDKQRMILRVPSGIYIVKASTQSCAQTKGQKIAVR